MVWLRLLQGGHTPIIKPLPLGPAVEGGFTGEDFSVDEGAQSVTCPNGVTRPMTKNRRVTFGNACHAWLTRGNRRVPYRGVAKNDTWLHHRVAAINLRRLLVLGLSHQDGTWTLAAA